jgi:high affinity Mn2+ porin
MIGGVQAGYNVQLPSGIVLGVEADLTFRTIIDSNSIVISTLATRNPRSSSNGLCRHLRGRSAMPRVTGCSTPPAASPGPASAYLNTPAIGSDEKISGRAARLGRRRRRRIRLRAALERAAGISLQPVRAAPTSAFLGRAARSTLDFQSLRVGLNRKIDWPGSAARCAEGFPDRSRIRPLGNPRPDHLSAARLSGFRALYTGTNSLTPAPQAQATWSNSLFLNVRLWEGGEVYYNPELLQGFGLNDTVGVAGFPNGEAQKSNFPYPHYNTSRLFLRQTFGFGGEQEELASGRCSSRTRSTSRG